MRTETRGWRGMDLDDREESSAPLAPRYRSPHRAASIHDRVFE